MTMFWNIFESPEAIKDNEIYVIELNARSSRSIPFVAKATGINWVDYGIIFGLIVEMAFAMFFIFSMKNLSKASGYPIARISTKIAIGYNLNEIRNPVTKNKWNRPGRPCIQFNYIYFVVFYGYLEVRKT